MLTWVDYKPPNSASKASATSRASRRTHFKSRNGCEACKKRRVKCDERLPACDRCLERETACHYKNAPQQHQDVEEAQSAQTLKANAVLLMDSCDTVIAKQCSKPGAPTSGLSRRLLGHFASSSVDTLSTPEGQEIILDQVSKVFLQYPFLLHSALGFSAAHLLYLGSADRTLVHAARYHTQEGLRLYTARVKDRMSPEEADAAFTTSLILVALFYSQDDTLGHKESWILPKPKEYARPDWTKILSGGRVLLSAQFSDDRMTSSSWGKVLQENAVRLNQRSARVTPSVPSFLYAAVSPPAISSADTRLGGENASDVYCQALQVLESITPESFESDVPGDESTTPFSPVEFSPLISFPARLSEEFVQLIKAGDDAAMLTVGFWFALMCRLRHCSWWSFERARDEGLAICSYLTAKRDSSTAISIAASMLADLFPKTLPPRCTWSNEGKGLVPARVEKSVTLPIC